MVEHVASRKRQHDGDSGGTKPTNRKKARKERKETKTRHSSPSCSSESSLSSSSSPSVSSLHMNEEQTHPKRETCGESAGSREQLSTHPSSSFPPAMDVGSIPPSDDNNNSSSDGGGAFFVIHINEKLTRVAVAKPFINLRSLFGQAGILLQDVTISTHPVLLLPCPQTGNVTVHPRRRYRLVKFAGEHLCLAGDFRPVAINNNNNSSQEMNECVSVISKQRRRQQRESWAMSELVGMMAYLRSHPRNTPDDFFALPQDEAALYHSRGNVALLGRNKHHETDGDDNNNNDNDVNGNDKAGPGIDDDIGGASDNNNKKNKNRKGQEKCAKMSSL